MSLKALTANTAPEENAHLLAEDDAAIFQSMFGEDGVLEIGQRMKATVISNNKVRVADGVVCIGGHIARTVYGDYTDLTIENGESGKNRNDLIIGTFSTTGAGGIDTMQLTVKKGAAGTAATDPALTQGNLYTGSKLREVPLWRVKIEGLSITKVEQLFEIVPSIPTLKKELESLNGNCIKVVDSKSITTNGYNYEYSILSFGDKRYVKLFGNYTIKNVNGTSFPPFVYNTITNLGLFPVNITTKIKKVLDFSLNCFNPGSGLFLIGGIKKHIATTNAYADVQFLMTNPPQNIGLEWMMVCEIE